MIGLPWAGAFRCVFLKQRLPSQYKNQRGKKQLAVLKGVFSLIIPLIIYYYGGIEH
jgi:hypothetical protein